MSPIRVVSLIAGLALVALLLFLWRGLETHPTSSDPPAPEKTALPVTPAAPAAVPSAPASPAEKKFTQEEKRRLSAMGAAARLEAAEARLAGVDFNQPRPAAPPPSKYVPKAERGLGPADRAVQLDNVITQLQSRIDTVEKRARETRARGGDATFEDRLAQRLRQRVTDLNNRSNLLHERAARGETAPPPAAPKPRVLGEQ